MINIQQLVSNPMVQNIMRSQNPQQMALSMLKNSPNANTEIGRNIIGMLERGDKNAIESYGRNLLQGQGMNPDEVYNNVKNMLGSR